MTRPKQAPNPDAGDPAETDRERSERLSAIVQAANSGEIETPVGCEDIVEALVDLSVQRDELAGKLIRAAADFQNFQRRALINEREAAAQARAGVVQRVLTVMDHFDLALNQGAEGANAEQIIGGVRVIRDELFKTLEAFGVSRIAPRPGDEFDPNIHEAMLRQPSEDIAPGRIVALLSVGYLLDDRVVRPAKVSVAPEQGED